ncbi:A disintegrin and metalloproteinase with thrombospondin motifs 6 [Plakobranchus ocellatus]|uniref:A disintegrin and metalloproteinase with thrombospondin motifs 6 n=1 Tax=Plakobranchus ocellatus TaxID=259542 RepID=A0AAV3YYL5_9GAST|nr:A disintegrin and metalloproteinase with thrombospondin motifs 6 [Plakobranchus ocellatus]
MLLHTTLLVTLTVLADSCSGYQFLWGLNQEMNALCPQKEGPSEVATPDECDVLNFIMCFNGIAVAINSCGQNQRFNRQKNECDFDELVPRPRNCEGRNNEPAKKICGNPGVQFTAKNETCKSYFACTTSGKQQMDCPKLSYFIAEVGRCMYITEGFRSSIPRAALDDCERKDPYTVYAASGEPPKRLERPLYWGQWSDWSECSSTCGQGVATRTRDCLTWSVKGSVINAESWRCQGRSERKKICRRQAPPKPPSCETRDGTQLQFDMCLRCKGDNSTCYLVQGVRKPSPEFPDVQGDEFIVLIPKGSTNINISKTGRARNSLALVNSQNVYLLNPTVSRRRGRTSVKGGNTVWTYDNTLGSESLATSGPLGEDILVLVVGESNKHKTFYSYWAPKNEDKSINKEPLHSALSGFESKTSDYSSPRRSEQKPAHSLKNSAIPDFRSVGLGSHSASRTSKFDKSNRNNHNRSKKNTYKREPYNINTIAFDRGHAIDLSESNRIPSSAGSSQSFPSLSQLSSLERQSFVPLGRTYTSGGAKFTNGFSKLDPSRPTNSIVQTRQEDDNNGRRIESKNVVMPRSSVTDGVRIPPIEVEKNSKQPSGRFNTGTFLATHKETRQRGTAVTNAAHPSRPFRPSRPPRPPRPPRPALVSRSKNLTPHRSSEGKGRDQRRKKRKKKKKKAEKKRKKAEEDDFMTVPLGASLSKVYVNRRKVLRKETRYDITILASYRNRVKLMSREYLWVGSRCRCPHLRAKRTYILMGRMKQHKDRQARLVIGPGAFVRGFSLGQDRRLRQLAQTLRCSD